MQGDTPHDLPLIVGFTEEGPAVLRLVGIVPDGSPRRRVLGDVLVNALFAARDERWVSYSRNNNFYPRYVRIHADMRKPLVIAAVELAERLGLIEHTKGRKWFDGGEGIQSRYRATQALIEATADYHLSRKRTAIAPERRDPLLLFGPDKEPIAYTETAKTRALRGEVMAYNAQLARHTIRITHPDVIDLGNGLLEIPTRDGQDTFLVRERFAYSRHFASSGRGRWDLHGRLYDAHWQSIPKTVRATITLDGGQTGRLDFGNSHLRIAYGEAGADPGAEDAYRISGYESDTGRTLIKVALNTMINAPTRDKAIRSVAYTLARRDRKLETGSEAGAEVGGFEMGKALRAVEAVERRHPALERVFCTGSGMRFMKIEADIVMRVIQSSIQRQIPVLSIHDELIAPADDLDVIEGMMRDSWRRSVPVDALVGH